jgi:hypothetical protein
MTGESTMRIVCSRRGLVVRLNGRGIWYLLAAIVIFCPILDGKRMLYSIQKAVLMAGPDIGATYERASATVLTPLD